MSGLVQWNMFLNAQVRIKAEVAASFDRRTAHRESRKAPQSRHDLVVHVARRAHFQFFCRVPFAKIFRFTRRANHLYKFAPSHPTRGAYHDRHERGVGCGGRGSVLRATGLQGESKDS